MPQELIRFNDRFKIIIKQGPERFPDGIRTGNTRGLPTTPATTRPVDTMNNMHDGPDTHCRALTSPEGRKHQCATG